MKKKKKRKKWGWGKRVGEKNKKEGWNMINEFAFMGLKQKYGFWKKMKITISAGYLREV